MARVIKATIQFHRGLAATWARNNPILAYGEPGFEKDTNKLKIGDGVTDWNSLQYFSDDYAKVRRDNEYNYPDDFIPELYEICFVDTVDEGLRAKLGDGVTQWVYLPYIDQHIQDEIKSIVIAGYYKDGIFYTDPEYTIECPAIVNTIYIDIPHSEIYIFNGFRYVPIQSTVVPASAETAGVMKLYRVTGQNEDGTMTQKAITDGLDNISGGLDVIATELTTKISASIDSQDNELLIFSTN